MKAVLVDDRRFVIRFDKDEEVIAGLAAFCQENGIAAASFSGIGACGDLELGYFNATLKDYRRKLFYDHMEIVSFCGNVSVSEGQPAVHAHGSFSDAEFNMLGGHVFKMVVAVTCEIFLIKLDGTLARENNTDFNLKLLV